MMLNFTPLMVVAVLLSTAAAHAQELTGAAAAQKVEGAVRIRMNVSGTAPDVVLFDPSKAVPADKIADLQRRLFGNRPDDSWTLIRSEEDKLGMVHARYQQRYKNREVEGCVYIFHAKGGKIVSAGGDFVPRIDLSAEPVVTEQQAIAFAAAGMKEPIDPQQADQTGAELVVLALDRQPVLAYRCTIFSRMPLVNRLVYVDAHNGNVLREVSLLCSTDVPGTAHTQFSGVQPIVSDQVLANQYVLRESGRGIETFNNATMQLYADGDNSWNNVNPSMDEFATDVHFGAEVTRDFFYYNFGRDSYDNNGGIIRSYVNDEWVGVNAYWSGGVDNTMHYGTGDADYYPVASLDVAGHELSHGVTEYSAGLQYFGESGALNESFSDIFGNTIRFLSAPSVATWYLGDQLLRPGGTGESAFRNMANPNEFACADTYGGQFFNNGDIVHFDSGIQNYWYYLLAEGGNGTNDLGNAFSVTGIGLNDAMHIAYRNLAYYLTPHSTFLDARDGAELAAIDLFGLCSEEHRQTIRAWYAVGVGPAQTVFQPEAGYANPNDFACSAPLSTQFFANGSYASYYWDFGDGTTSALQNPAHVYQNDGYYTVTLIVSNDNSCQDPDTLIVTNGIVIDHIDPVAGFTTQGPLIYGSPIAFTDASLYGPVSWEWDFGDGGTSTLQNPLHTFADTGYHSVQLTVHNCHGEHTVTQQVYVMDYLLFCQYFDTDRPEGVIFDPGGINGNYGSNTDCSMYIHPCNASSITLTFEEFDLEDGHDYFYAYDATGMPLGFFTGNTIPGPITANTGTVHLHFSSDGSNELSGFRISYTSANGNNPGPNSTHFIVSPGMSSVGELVQFIDYSTHPAVEWLWDFGDGNTSVQQHPSHTYSLPGMYEVTLTATYCDGYTDDWTMTYYVGGPGLEELAAGHLLSVAPNPFSESFVLLPGAHISEVALRLLDMSGREVFTQYIQDVQPQGITIDPAGLSNGHYLLEVAYLLDGASGRERCRIQVQR